MLNETVRLSSNGITTPLSFFGRESEEPSALCYMSIVSVLFHDPDGHLLEYLEMSNDEPKPSLGINTWSKWLDHRGNV